MREMLRTVCGRGKVDVHQMLIHILLVRLEVMAIEMLGFTYREKKNLLMILKMK